MQLIGWLEPRSYYRPGPEAQRKIGSEPSARGGGIYNTEKSSDLQKRDKKILKSQK